MDIYGDFVSRAGMANPGPNTHKWFSSDFLLARKFYFILLNYIFWCQVVEKF